MTSSSVSHADGLLHLMRAAGKDRTGHAIWACPLCPAEPQPKTYQRPSALHGHLEACHSQQLKHVKMAAYLTAFSLMGQHKLVARLSGMRHSADDNPKSLKFSSQKRKSTASPDAQALVDPATETVSSFLAASCNHLPLPFCQPFPQHNLLPHLQYTDKALKPISAQCSQVAFLSFDG